MSYYLANQKLSKNNWYWNINVRDKLVKPLSPSHFQLIPNNTVDILHHSHPGIIGLQGPHFLNCFKSKFSNLWSSNSVILVTAVLRAGATKAPRRAETVFPPNRPVDKMSCLVQMLCYTKLDHINPHLSFSLVPVPATLHHSHIQLLRGRGCSNQSCQQIVGQRKPLTRENVWGLFLQKHNLQNVEKIFVSNVSSFFT